MSWEQTAATNSSADTVAVVAMSLLTAVALVGNMVVLVAIARSPSLRVQLTNFFVVNLCVVDVVGATIVMPVSLVGVQTLPPSANTSLSTQFNNSAGSAYCSGFRVLSTFAVFASVLSIALANVERYVSIRHPMWHAAHLTVGRTLTAIVGVWAAALGVAAVPVIVGWDILDVGTRCRGDGRVSLHGHTAAAVFAVVVVALLFVAPTFMMAAMFCSIYRVARKAGRQVAPGVDDGRTRGSSSTINATSCSVVSCPALNNIQPHNDTANQRGLAGGKDTLEHPASSQLPVSIRNAPEYVIRITSHESGASTAAIIADQGRHTVSPIPTETVDAQLTQGVVADRRWKAALTLLFVLLTFMPLWTPYFAYSLYLAVGCDTVVSDDDVETAVVWVGFATFASNSFVYGWMNRAIRDALRDTASATFGRCSLAQRGRARLSQVLGVGDAEDFFQFLERTSSFDRTQSITQSAELTTVN